MSRRYKLKLFLLILTFCLVLVNLILQYTTTNTQKFQLPLKMTQKYSSTFNRIQKPLLQLFLQIMKDFHIFLIEPKVLLSIVKEEKDITNNVFTFGLRLDKTHKLELSTFDEFKQHGFKVFPVISNKEKFSHVILYHEKSLFLVHLIIFYEKWEGFIKSESLVASSSFPSWLPHKQLTFGDSGYGYNRLDLAKVNLYVDELTLYIPTNMSRFINEDLPQSTFLECDLKRVNQFYAAYPDYKVSYRNLHYKANKLLQDLRETMDEIGVKFFLDGGTLLGWYRQCDMIYNTSDIDIGIFAKDYKPEVQESFISHGFNLFNLYMVPDGFEMKLDHYDIRLDVFLLYEGEYDNWTGGLSSNGTKYRFVFPKFKLCWGELLQVPVRVPCNALEVVKNSYGDGWNRSVKDWSWNESPKNIITVGNYSEDEMKDIIISLPGENLLKMMKRWLHNIFIDVHYYFIYLFT